MTRRHNSTATAGARIAAAAAAAGELRDEQQCPAAQRHPVMGGDGTMLRDALAERGSWDDPNDLDNYRSKGRRQAYGFRRVSVLRNLHLRSGLVTENHLHAAERLSLDYERGMGARPNYERPAVRLTTAVGPFAGLPEGQMHALARYRAAVEVLGQRLCAVLLPVVLSNIDLTEIARRMGMNSHAAHGYLAAALDVLVEHYEGSKNAPRQAA